VSPRRRITMNLIFSYSRVAVGRCHCASFGLPIRCTEFWRSWWAHSCETHSHHLFVGVSSHSIPALAREIILWNIVYDGPLHALESVKDLNAVAFSDDLALIITIRKMQDICDRVREAMKVVTDWCAESGLHLAQKKTEIILLTGKSVPKIFNINIRGT
jgi:hypothetical protein